MIKNFEIMIEKLNQIIRQFYKQIEKYLENILNAPSTINRIIKYYAIGFDINEPNKRYICFGGVIVAEYELIIPKIDMGGIK